MSEPTPKSGILNDLLSVFSGKDREATIRSNECMTCGGKWLVFRDTESQKEYTISGMCQKCQDSVFKWSLRV